MYHLLWMPKYRKRLLDGKIAERLKELLHECSDMHRWKIEELNIHKDHVRIVVHMKPDVSVSKMVQLFKDSSSKVIREEFQELRFLWGQKLLGRWVFCRNFWPG